jgi:hypothetical protein
MDAVYLPDEHLCPSKKLSINEEWPACAGHRFEGVAGTVSLSGASPRTGCINLYGFQTPLKYLTDVWLLHKTRKAVIVCIFSGKEKARMELRAEKGGTSMWRNRKSLRTSLREYANASSPRATP